MMLITQVFIDLFVSTNKAKVFIMMSIFSLILFNLVFGNISFCLPGMGTLNLYLQRSQTGSEQLLFRESGDHGNQWIQSRVDVYSSVDYFLIFEAVQDIDVASLSDMALDDIKFLPYPCNSIRKFVICGWL